MYNKNFQLDPKDIRIIEQALRACSHDRKEVEEVLAKIHHQKIWYRPKDEIYVSG